MVCLCRCASALFAYHHLVTSPSTSPLAYLPAVFVAGPLVISILLPLLIFARHRKLVDLDELRNRAFFHGAMLVLSPSNREVLRLLPWRESRLATRLGPPALSPQPFRAAPPCTTCCPCRASCPGTTAFLPRGC